MPEGFILAIAVFVDKLAIGLNNSMIIHQANYFQPKYIYPICIYIYIYSQFFNCGVFNFAGSFKICRCQI